MAEPDRHDVSSAPRWVLGLGIAVIVLVAAMLAVHLATGGIPHHGQ